MFVYINPLAMEVEDEKVRLDNLCVKVLSAHVADLIIYWAEVMTGEEIL